MAPNRQEREQREKKRANAGEWAQKQSEKFTPTCVHLPKGTESFRLSPGTYNVDFFEYEVGRGNPNADEGFYHFERQYEAHNIPTPDGNRKYVCMRKTFGKPCPVCEWLQVNGRTHDPKGQMREKRYHLWLMRDRDEKGQQIRVFDSNHFNRGMGFGEMMADPGWLHPDPHRQGTVDGRG
jgi:hypothetical protein